MIGSKKYMKAWIFQYEMDYKWQKMFKIMAFIYLLIIFFYIGKFQYILFLKFSFDCGIIFNLILILLSHIFWIHIFHFIYMINIESSFENSIMSPLVF
jgi:hypothetical protein